MVTTTSDEHHGHNDDNQHVDDDNQHVDDDKHTVNKTDSMTQVLYEIQAAKQDVLTKFFAMPASSEPIVTEKPNFTTVTVAQRIDVRAAAESGGLASIAVSGNMTGEDGEGETTRFEAAVPVSMIQQLVVSGGAGVVLMVSASKASATEENFIPLAFWLTMQHRQQSRHYRSP